MSWSLCYTGKRSIIKDAEQRVALNIDIKEISDEMESTNFILTCTELAAQYFLHFSVTISDPVNVDNVDEICDKLQTIAALERQLTCSFHPNGVDYDPKYRKAFFTLQMHHDATLLWKRILGLDFYFDLLVLHIGDSVDLALGDISEALAIAGEKDGKTAIGIGSISDEDSFHWLLDRIDRAVVILIHLGALRLPNIRIRMLELAYTWGCNCMIDIQQDELWRISSNQEYTAMATKYVNISNDAFIVKALLQLGLIVTLPFSLEESGYIHEHHARLVHPFVWRKSFVSVHRLISLRITDDDVDMLRNQSEEEEVRSDAKWIPHAQGRAELRALTFTPT